MNRTGGAITKTRAQLADGRDIVYFDEDGHSHLADDSRPLPPEASSPTLRYDAILGEWITVASHRQERTHLPPEHSCPLCPSRNGRGTEIPAEDYDVVVLENRFPAFSGRTYLGLSSLLAEAFREQPALGRCEVICFTADHDAALSHLPSSRVRTILEAWIDRTEELSRLPYVEQVFCFENRGEEIGVTLSHPHGQIYGYPFVTPRMQRMLDNARQHRERTSGNLFADTLAAEIRKGDRVVLRGDHWSAFVPFAARWPLEVHLYLNRQVQSLPDLTDEERQEFCTLYPSLLRRMEGAYGPQLPYISAWYQAPVHADDGEGYLHLQVFSVRRAPGKLKYLAGSESAMGSFINDVIPEQTARKLRDVDPGEQ